MNEDISIVDQSKVDQQAKVKEPGKLARFSLTAEYDPASTALKYKVDIDPTFPFPHAVNLLEKVKLRFLMDQLQVELMSIAQHQAQKIQTAQHVPPAPLRRR